MVKLQQLKILSFPLLLSILVTNLLREDLLTIKLLIDHGLVHHVEQVIDPSREVLSPLDYPLLMVSYTTLSESLA